MSMRCVPSRSARGTTLEAGADRHHQRRPCAPCARAQREEDLAPIPKHLARFQRSMRSHRGSSPRERGVNPLLRGDTKSIASHAMDKYTAFTLEGSEHLTNESLSALEERLAWGRLRADTPKRAGQGSCDSSPSPMHAQGYRVTLSDGQIVEVSLSHGHGRQEGPRPRLLSARLVGGAQSACSIRNRACSSKSGRSTAVDTRCTRFDRRSRSQHCAYESRVCRRRGCSSHLHRREASRRVHP